MTVAELGARISQAEYEAWRIYFARRAQERQLEAARLSNG